MLREIDHFFISGCDESALRTYGQSYSAGLIPRKQKPIPHVIIGANCIATVEESATWQLGVSSVGKSTYSTSNESLKTLQRDG